MQFITYSQLVQDIRDNIYKIPNDIDVIVGVPRSGMIPTLIIAEYLNKKCVDLDSFLDNKYAYSMGLRGDYVRDGKSNKVLVLDDTCCTGSAMNRVKEKLKDFSQNFEIIYGCIYCEQPESKNNIDIYLKDVSNNNLVIQEWNILHRYHWLNQRSIWDIDGLVCKEPPDETNTIEYEQYISNAVPMIIPSSPIAAFCTYRLEKYRQVTQEWLQKYNVPYNQLIMFPSENSVQRNNWVSPSQYKSEIYLNLQYCVLFVESDDYQAQEIYNITHKNVFCYSTGKLYGTNDF